MKILAILKTYDASDCTSTGYEFTLYSDGHVAADSHSRWQGTTDGARYITGPGYVDVSRINESDPDSDAEAVLTDAVRDVFPDDPGGEWRMTRRGRIVG